MILNPTNCIKKYVHNNEYLLKWTNEVTKPQRASVVIIGFINVALSQHTHISHMAGLEKLKSIDMEFFRWDGMLLSNEKKLKWASETVASRYALDVSWS